MNLVSDFKHYLGIALVLVVAYFTVIGPFLDRRETSVTSGVSQVTAPAPKPSGPISQAVNEAAQAASSVAIASALKNDALQLSTAQATVARTMSAVTGLRSDLSGALASGLTTAAPQEQVVHVATSTVGKASASPAPDDDAIKRDLKDVLNDPSTQIHTVANVTVGWQDKKVSPFFAFYGTNGSGLGYTATSVRGLNLDALLTNSSKGPGIGAGIEHLIPRTSAGVGADATWNFTSKSVGYGVFFSIRQ